jgi:TonB family protein
LVALLASTSVLAQTSSGQSTNGDTAPHASQGMAFRPPFPPGAGKNHEQGVVLLKVLVGVDGSAHKVEADPDNKASPELTKAASEAAIKWQYPPQQQKGKMAEEWIRVPVLFSLTLLPPHPPGSLHGDMLPPPPFGHVIQPSSPNS